MITSPFIMPLRPHPYLTNCGWDEFLRGLASPISPKLALRFEAFPAVYRAPGPLLAPPGYEFPRSSRMDLCITASIHSSPFSSFTHDQAIAISFWDITLRVQVALSIARSRNSWVSPQPFCEARGFSPLLESLPDPFFAFLVPLGGGQDSASDITSRCSPSSHPSLTLLRQGPDGHRY